MIFRSIMSFLISYSLALYPVQARTVSQQDMLRQYIKESGLGSQMTVAAWIKKNHEAYHPKVAELAHQWALKNPNVKIPKVEMTSFDGPKGEEITRLVFAEKGKSTIVDIVTLGENTYFQVDGKKYSYDDIYYDGMLEEQADSSQLTWNELTEIHKIDKSKAANYQTAVRGLVNSLTMLDEGLNLKPTKTSFIDLILEKAYAIPNGANCIMAGYVTTESRSSCGGSDPQLSEGCATGNVKCNPLVYGYDAGKEKCVPRAPATEVSPKCDALYPIPGQEKALIDSVISTVNGSAKSPEEKDKAWSDFFTNLESQIKGASDVCLGSGFDFAGYKKSVKDNGQQQPFQAGQFIQNFPVQKDKSGKDINEHHRIACEKVMNRLFYMDCGQECARQMIAADKAHEPQQKPESVECKYAGATTFALADTPPAKMEPLPPVAPAKVEKKKHSIWPWIIGGIAALCIFKIICGGKKKIKHPVLPPMPVGKPGEPGIHRPGSGGVGGGVSIHSSHVPQIFI